MCSLFFPGEGERRFSLHSCNGCTRVYFICSLVIFPEEVEESFYYKFVRTQGFILYKVLFVVYFFLRRGRGGFHYKFVFLLHLVFIQASREMRGFHYKVVLLVHNALMQWGGGNGIHYKIINVTVMHLFVTYFFSRYTVKPLNQTLNIPESCL